MKSTTDNCNLYSLISINYHFYTYMKSISKELSWMYFNTIRLNKYYIDVLTWNLVSWLLLQCQNSKWSAFHIKEIGIITFTISVVIKLIVGDHNSVVTVPHSSLDCARMKYSQSAGGFVLLLMCQANHIRNDRHEQTCLQKTGYMSYFPTPLCS